MENKTTTDFAVISKEFDEKVNKSFWALYGLFIESFTSFVGQAKVEHLLDMDSVQGCLKSKNIQKIRFHNKTQVIHNCLAYFDVSQYLKNIVPNVSSGVKICLLEILIENGAVVVVDGQRVDKQDINKK